MLPFTVFAVSLRWLSQVAYNPDEEPMEDMFEFEAEGMNLYEQIMGFRVAYRRFV